LFWDDRGAGLLFPRNDEESSTSADCDMAYVVVVDRLSGYNDQRVTWKLINLGKGTPPNEQLLQ
jgi:hypothetical protein